jgi:hypothetical protein
MLDVSRPHRRPSCHVRQQGVVPLCLVGWPATGARPARTSPPSQQLRQREQCPRGGARRQHEVSRSAARFRRVRKANTPGIGAGPSGSTHRGASIGPADGVPQRYYFMRKCADCNGGHRIRTCKRLSARRFSSSPLPFRVGCECPIVTLRKRDRGGKRGSHVAFVCAGFARNVARNVARLAGPTGRRPNAPPERRQPHRVSRAVGCGNLAGAACPSAGSGA